MPSDGHRFNSPREALDAMSEPSKCPRPTHDAPGYAVSGERIENLRTTHPEAGRFDDHTMTVPEVAKILGISASKLYQLVAGRRIAHYRVGGKILFMAEDVAAYLATCRVGAVAPIASAPRVQIKLKHLRLS